MCVIKVIYKEVGDLLQMINLDNAGPVLALSWMVSIHTYIHVILFKETYKIQQLNKSSELDSEDPISSANSCTR